MSHDPRQVEPQQDALHDAERRATESQRRFEAVFERSPIGIHRYALHPDGRLVFLGGNRAADAMLGISHANLVGQRIEDAFPALAATEIPDRYRQICREGTSWHTEHVDYQDLRLRGAFEVHAFQTADGEMAAMFTDISARLRASAEQAELHARMQQNQRLESLGLLAGGVAHEFNNLLCGVLGQTDLVSLDLEAGHQASPAVEQIRVAALRAAELCRQLLAYSGRGRFVVGPVDLTALVKDTSKLVELSVGPRASLRLDLSPSVPLVEADGNQLRQVLLNLVVNAAEAMGGRHGAITIRTGERELGGDQPTTGHSAADLPAGRYVSLEVEDDGEGMDEQTRRRLFDPFFTTKFVGRGLGLPAVFGIVRGHGGKVQVTSQLGTGTLVQVLLPAMPPQPAAPARSPAATTPRWTGTVLVADDEPAVRDIASRCLERMGLRVLGAGDGHEAIALVRSHGTSIDLALLDLGMPRLSGEQTLVGLRRLCPSLPVILMSGYDEQDAVARCGEVRFSGFLRKPFTIDELEQAVSAVLERLDGGADASSPPPRS